MSDDQTARAQWPMAELDATTYDALDPSPRRTDRNPPPEADAMDFPQPAGTAEVAGILGIPRKEVATGLDLDPAPRPVAVFGCGIARLADDIADLVGDEQPDTFRSRPGAHRESIT